MHTITLMAGKLTGFNPSDVLPAGVLDKADLIGFCHHIVYIFSDPGPSIKVVIAEEKPNPLL